MFSVPIILLRHSGHDNCGSVAVWCGVVRCGAVWFDFLVRVGGETAKMLEAVDHTQATSDGAAEGGLLSRVFDQDGCHQAFVVIGSEVVVSGHDPGPGIEVKGEDGVACRGGCVVGEVLVE